MRYQSIGGRQGRYLERVLRAVGLVVFLVVFTIAGLSTVEAAASNDSTGSFNAEQTRAIEKIVRGYLLNHPEVIFDAAKKLRAKQERAREEARRDAMNAVRPVTSADHIRGNPDAPVKIIEFSDFECPFCKRFQATMKRVIEDYGDDGKVAWVYRHFPLDSLHSKARKEAQASECANELGGNDAFWRFADRIFKVTPSNNGLDPAQLPNIAEQIGLDRAKFERCLSGDARGGKYAEHIAADLEDANTSGGTGTPYTLVVGPTRKIYPINGALSYAAVKSIIDVALKGE